MSEKEKTSQIKEDLAAKQADIQQVQMIMKNAQLKREEAHD